MCFWREKSKKSLKKGDVKNILQTYIGGLIGWEMAKGTTFLETFFIETHFPVQILIKFGGKFSWREIERDVRRIVDEKVYKKVQQQFFPVLRMNLSWTGK